MRGQTYYALKRLREGPDGHEERLGQYVLTKVGTECYAQHAVEALSFKFDCYISAEEFNHTVGELYLRMVGKAERAGGGSEVPKGLAPDVVEDEGGTEGGK